MKVLIVDDSVTMRRIEATQLSQLGITDILQAENGRIGFEILIANMPVDVILLDINMPEMDNMTLLKKIRSDPKFSTVKIVMVTSESEKVRVLEALRAGANDYMVKPFSLNDFTKRITI